MWDSRWLWGLPHLQHPSSLWLLCAILSTAKLACHISAIKHSVETREDEMVNEFTITDWRDIVAIIVLVSLWWRQRMIEQRQWLSFRINEAELHVGSYLRRKEALYTWQARVLLLIGFIKITGFILAWWRNRQTEESFNSKSVIEWADEAATLNLIILLLILIVMRVSTLIICQKKCPYFLMNFKAALSGVPKKDSTSTKKSN